MTITTRGRHHPGDPAERIEHGRMTLHNAKTAMWPEEGGKAIRDVMDALDFALGVAETIETDEIHPASWYPELAGEAEGKWHAMDRIAEEVTEWAGELARLFPAAAVVAEGAEAA